MSFLFAIFCLFFSPVLSCLSVLRRLRRRPSPARALKLLIEAMDIACAYEEDANYRPTEEELAVFFLFQHALAHNRTVARHILFSLSERRVKTYCPR